MTGRRPTLCVVAGPNGSGKTTTTIQLLNNEWAADSLYINPDNIAQETRPSPLLTVPTFMTTLLIISFHVCYFVLLMASYSSSTLTIFPNGLRR